LKDPDTDSLDAGWDESPSDPAPGPDVSVASSSDIDELDAGWDDAPSDPAIASSEARSEGLVAPARSPRARPEQMSKRERRAFERKKRALGEKRRAERRAEEKDERQKALRRAADERETERRQARERTEAVRREREPKRSSEPRAPKAGKPRPRERSPETLPKAETRSKRGFVMPNGGWIVFVIGLITLGTAWYAFGR
jgi:hypothetical protein